MIWFIEIQHQRRPSCWVANDEQDAINRIVAASPRDAEAFDIETFDQAVAYLDSDLSSLIVFKTDEEAVAALDDNVQWQRHGGYAAYDRLREKLVDYGLITELVDED